MSEAATTFQAGTEGSAEPSVAPSVAPVASVAVAEPQAPIIQATEAASAASPEERAWLSADYREDARLSKFANADDLAKSYIGAESLISKSIRIPGQDASDKQRAEFYAKLEEVPGVSRIPTDPQDQEGWDKYYNRMGRPASSDEYSVQDPNIQSLHHSIGLSESQSARLQRAEAERTTASNDAANAQAVASGDALNAEWGEGAQRNFTNIKLAAMQFGGESLINELNTNPAIGNNIPLMKALVAVAETMGDKGVPLSSAAANFNMTVDQANEQIVELRNNPAYAAREQWAVDRMSLLYKKSTPK